MEKVHYREESFLNCPNGVWKFDDADSPLYHTEMAEAGFVFMPTPKLKDRVICFSCSSAFYNWKKDSNPFLRHLQRSPTCSWIQCRSLNRISSETRAQLNLPLPDILSEALTKARFETFIQWPHSVHKDWICTIPKSKLAQAGFYFTPLREGADAVTCISCETILLDWSAEDDPQANHLEINPNCKYLLQAEKNGYPTYGISNGQEITVELPSKNLKRRKLEAEPSLTYSALVDISSTSDSIANSSRRSTRIQKKQEKLLNEKIERKRRRKIRKDLEAGRITQDEATALYEACLVPQSNSNLLTSCSNNTSFISISRSDTTEPSSVFLQSMSILPDTPISTRKTTNSFIPTAEPDSSDAFSNQPVEASADEATPSITFHRVTYSRRSKATPKNLCMPSSSDEGSSAVDSEYEAASDRKSKPNLSSNHYKSNSHNLTRFPSLKSKTDSSKSNSSKTPRKIHLKSTNNYNTTASIETKKVSIPENKSSKLDEESTSADTSCSTLYDKKATRNSKKRDRVSSSANKHSKLSKRHRSEDLSLKDSKLNNEADALIEYSSQLSDSSALNSKLDSKLKPKMQLTLVSDKTLPPNTDDMNESSDKQDISSCSEFSNSSHTVSSRKNSITSEMGSTLESSSTIRRSKRIPLMQERREKERLERKKKRREARLLKAKEAEARALKHDGKEPGKATSPVAKSSPPNSSRISDLQLVSSKLSHGLRSSKTKVNKPYSGDKPLNSLNVNFNTELNNDGVESDGPKNKLNLKHVSTHSSSLPACSVSTFDDNVPSVDISPVKIQPLPDQCSKSLMSNDDADSKVQHPESPISAGNAYSLAQHPESPISDSDPYSPDQHSEPLIHDNDVHSYVRLNVDGTQTDKSLPDPENIVIAKDVTCDEPSNTINFPQGSIIAYESPKIVSSSSPVFHKSDPSVTSSPKRSETNPGGSANKITSLTLTEAERSLTLEQFIYKLARDQIDNLEVSALARCQALDDLLSSAKDW